MDGYSHDYLLRIFQQSSGFFKSVLYNESNLTILQRIVNATSLSIQNVMDQMQSSCDEILVRCRLEGKITPCHTLFKPVISQYGLCCSFNRNNTQK